MIRTITTRKCRTRLAKIRHRLAGGTPCNLVNLRPPKERKEPQPVAAVLFSGVFPLTAENACGYKALQAARPYPRQLAGVSSTPSRRPGRGASGLASSSNKRTGTQPCHSASRAAPDAGRTTSISWWRRKRWLTPEASPRHLIDRPDVMLPRHLPRERVGDIAICSRRDAVDERLGAMPTRSQSSPASPTIMPSAPPSSSPRCAHSVVRQRAEPAT